MNLNPTEVNIRASWALNCAVASVGEKFWNDRVELERIVLDRAKLFLTLLDQVKAVIQPPMTNTVGKSKAEKKEIARDSAENDAPDYPFGNEPPEIAMGDTN